MKKLFSFISTIILLWAIFMSVEYFRSYRGDEKLLVTLDTEVTDEYTKRTGLGFSIIDYDVNEEDLRNGTIIKEFYIFNFRVSKTIAII